MNRATRTADSPTDDATPPPRAVTGLLRPPAVMPPDLPTPETVLRAVLDSGGPWFPSAHAKRTGVPRHALDDALAELREAGLVRIATWERGVGQGYVATPEGERAARAEPAAPEPVSPALAGLLDFRPPLITPALIGASVLWFAYGVAVAPRLNQPRSAALTSPAPLLLERLGAVSAPDLLGGEWWRLITSAFVHVGMWHLILNTVTLATTGPAAELFWGRWRTLALYLLAGVSGAAAAMAHRPSAGPGDMPVILAGASGAIWGLMGAVLAWYVRYRPDLPPDLAADMGRRLILALLLNAGVSMLPHVSWEAHLGGGLAGYLGAGLFDAVRSNPRPRRRLAAALLVALPVGFVGGLVFAMRYSDEWAVFRTQPTRPAVDPLAVLEPVRPEAALPVRKAAVRVWLVGPEVRDRHRAVARAGIDMLARRVGASVERMTATGEPVANALAAAAARVRELDRLRELVDQSAMPTVEEWQSWGVRRREADGFWPSAP